MKPPPEPLGASIVVPGLGERHGEPLSAGDTIDSTSIKIMCP